MIISYRTNLSIPENLILYFSMDLTNMSKKIIFIILGIGLLFIFLFTFVGKDKIEEKQLKNSYSFLNAEKGKVLQTVNVDGTVVTTQEVDLRFQANGVIDKINYSVGDDIKKGDLLANLNSRDQEIAVKQHQAYLAQAQANLNLKLVGASDEDIAVYQSKVDTAKKNIESTLNSTSEDIKNSEVRIASAQTALDEAIKNLEIIEKQNSADLSIAYKEAQRVIDSSLLTIEKTLDDVNDFWENDDLDDLFSVKNSQYKSESSYKYNQAKSSYENLLAESRIMDFTNYAGIDNLLDKTKNNLNDVQSFLDSVFNGLVSTITSSGLTQTSLETYKGKVNSLRLSANTAISSIESKEQSILQINTKFKTSVSGVKASINMAQATLELEKANLESVRSKADAQNSQAENSLELVNSEYNLKISTPRDEDIAYLRAKVYEASALLDLARENLNKTILVSPVAGVIVDVEFEVGESINNSNVFAKLTANEKKVEADIPEIEIGKVAIGDEVEIVLDAFVDKIFSGKIIAIDPIETNIQGVVYYKTDIAFNDATSSRIVLPGMTADVNILTDSKSDVLTLPRSSVKKDDKRFYVQVFENEEIKLRDVYVGLVGNEKVEIISGIIEKDKIVDFILKSNQ